MNIAFFTENPFYGKLQRNQGGRTDANWFIALDATHVSFNHSPDTSFEVGIIIVPKKNPERAFAYYEKYRNKCRKWCAMQEGNHQLWQDFPVETQISYLNFLNELDIIFCHNESDQFYFQGLFPEKQVEVFSSVLIEESMPQIPHENRSGSIISGNMCSWYGGMDSFIVGQILGEQVYAPSMGRKQSGEDAIEQIKYLPYLAWQDWFLELNKRKYGINMMRTFAAGSFSLACARLGIPCIGWGRNDIKSPEGMDTQRLLFPELTVPTGNMVQAIGVANHLKENQLFYDHCSQYAKKAYDELFSEKIFIDKFINILKKD